MTFFRSRLIWGVVEKVIQVVVKTVVKILSFFHLLPAVLTAIVGLILYLTGALNDATVNALFWCVVALSLFYAVVKTTCKIFGVGKKKEKRGKVKILKDESVSAQVVEQPQPKEEKIEEVSHQTKFQVKYYQVAQNPAYVYAEHEDRYELYYKTPQGLLRVRTDYKR